MKAQFPSLTFLYFMTRAQLPESVDLGRNLECLHDLHDLCLRGTGVRAAHSKSRASELGIHMPNGILPTAQSFNLTVMTDRVHLLG